MGGPAAVRQEGEQQGIGIAGVAGDEQALFPNQIGKPAGSMTRGFVYVHVNAAQVEAISFAQRQKFRLAGKIPDV